MPNRSSGSAAKDVPLEHLMKVALGEMEADLAVINGDVVNVYTGEVISGDTILVKGSKVAYVGGNAQNSIGSGTQVIDAAGKVVIPGLIDGHTHIDWFMAPSELIRYGMQGGTTTIITEIPGIAFPLGYPGVMEFIRAVRNQPIRIFVTVPPMVTKSPVSQEHAITVEQARRLLKMKEVIGLGESYWMPVVGGEPRVLSLMAEAKKAGKKIDGHSAGARDNKLQAYAALGVTSCHEPTTVDEVLERLRLGMYVMVREGEIRRELEEIARIKDEKIDFRLMGLATDGPGPWQLLHDGYMEFVVQKAINLGFEPVLAIQMSSLNIAQRFGLDDSIGGIAPGRFADMLIIPDLNTIRAEYVISNGEVVSRNGQLTVEPRKHVFPEWMLHTVHLPRDFVADDFAIRVDGDNNEVKVRVMDMVTDLVSREAILDLVVSGGEVLPDVERDIVKVAAIDRSYEPGRRFVGFVRGLGLKRGAIAATTMWDTSDIGVIGVDGAEMALAVNRIKELSGGIVVIAEGKVVAEIALPIGALFSLDPVETIVEKLDGIQRASEDLGCVSADIRLTASVLSATAIPFLRICEAGMVDLKKNCFVDLIVD